MDCLFYATVYRVRTESSYYISYSSACAPCNTPHQIYGVYTSVRVPALLACDFVDKSWARGILIPEDVDKLHGGLTNTRSVR
jgi:hypothetical protein